MLPADSLTKQNVSNEGHMETSVQEKAFTMTGQNYYSRSQQLLSNQNVIDVAAVQLMITCMYFCKTINVPVWPFS